MPQAETDRLTALRQFIQFNLGPAEPLTDAQIGLIVIYVRDHFAARPTKAEHN